MRRLKHRFFSVLVIAGLLIGSSGQAERSISAVVPFKNWGLVNTKNQSHINAVDAWKIEQGSKDVIVAVIDTGIDPDHKNLKNNVWKSPGDDNVYGWNFVSNKPNPGDEHGHGTHVAGIIGAVSDPETGISGVVHRVSIMPVKYYSEANTGAVNLRNTVKAIEYAVKNGAKIINYSGGGPDFSEEEYLAIKKAEAAGVLFVAAAGNERQDTDKAENYYYPSAYGLSNIISVAATDINNNLLKSSNWGKKKVDLAAPGENIYSTMPGGKYGYMSGTSQATAFVSGVAAMLLSQDPSLTPAQLKKLIVESTDKLPQLKGKVASEGRVNAYAALTALRQTKGLKPFSDPKKPSIKPNAPILAHQPPGPELARRPTELLKALSSLTVTE